MHTYMQTYLHTLHTKFVCVCVCVRARPCVGYSHALIGNHQLCYLLGRKEQPKSWYVLYVGILVSYLSDMKPATVTSVL
jgi:hypothetical protein